MKNKNHKVDKYLTRRLILIFSIIIYIAIGPIMTDHVYSVLSPSVNNMKITGPLRDYLLHISLSTMLFLGIFPVLIVAGIFGSELLKWVIKGPEGTDLGGKIDNVTAFFEDIPDFFSGKNKREEIASLEFLQELQQKKLQEIEDEIESLESNKNEYK